ncbi:MAG: ATP-binding cassette domain-containing protein, partial [Saccharofermentans sp.]|nr:ATP-binding cassette domain-containing protein [Saccharofermentans sp.]
MGHFGSQIEDRRKAEQELLEDSLVKIAGIVMGQATAQKMSDDRIITKDAIDDIVKSYHLKPVDVPDNVTGFADQLDYCLRPHGLMSREVELEDGWYKDGFGPILAFTKEEESPVALLPRKMSGYKFKDPETGKMTRLDSKTMQKFDRRAICFYRPLPQKKLKIRDLLNYMRSCLSLADIIPIVLATLALSAIGLVMPRLTRLLTGPVLNSGRKDVLLAIAISMVCVAFATQLMNGIKGMIQKRLDIKTSLGVQSAMMMRLLSLPAGFFRQYSPGELKSRSMSVNSLCSLLLSMILGTGLTSITSLVYVGQIFNFAPSLVIPSVLIVLATVVFSIVTTLAQIKISRQQMEYSAQESGLTYGLITGVQKIKLAGAEKRVFAKWLDVYSLAAELTYNPPLFLKLNTVISSGIALAGNILLYYMAARSNIDVSSYFAFTAAYGMLMGAFMSVSGIAVSAAQIKPILDLAKPFLESEPEVSDGKEIVTSISGGVEISHVSFRYDETMPNVLDDISLKIRAGEYVAIVGSTGCGKSTLVRLLLGFEKPEKGIISYDGKDMSGLDISSLRKKIGTVMQDSGLFQGDIYQNIVITAPELTLEDAWKAAETAGIAEDIKAMPMGMNTLISEGQGGISGGQRQRIMIARAIAPSPKLLIFDEATSALDNKTQKQVSQALDKMGCTRIVIAHRLSTIKHCDRILVL